jgi:hypothetical protein
MKLSNNDAAVRTGSLDLKADSSDAGEIDLYDELITFAELPEEQRRIAPHSQWALAEGREGGGDRHAHLEPRRTTGPIELPTSAHVDDDSRSETSVASPGRFPAFGNSGPLGSLSKGSHFKGAMTGGVCLACGAASGANDLFCITCGAFVDEVAVPIPSGATCVQCGLSISADDIFCPQCGAVLPAP